MPIKFGRIYFSAELVNSYHYRIDTNNKVYLLEQKSKLVNDLSVADNVFVLRKGFKKYSINKKVLHGQLIKLMEEIEVRVDSKEICLGLTEYDRCVVEILKSIIQGTRLLIIHVISNVLSSTELESFKKILIRVAAQGCSILYVGNHHEEVFPVSDRAVFMKDGRIIKVFDKKEMLDKFVLPYTISYEDTYKGKTSIQDANIIEFHNITVGDLKEISFDMREGECVVLYDKSRKVQQEIMECLLGEREFDNGYIKVSNHLMEMKEIQKMQIGRAHV